MASRGGFRPRWPFRPNRASPQWANLAYWWPVTGEDMKNPVELVQGARATRDVGSDLSFVASGFAGGSVPNTTGSVGFADRLKLGLQTLSLAAGSLSIWGRSSQTSVGSDSYVFGRNKAGNNAGDVGILLASGINKVRGLVQDGTNTRTADSTLAMDTSWHHYLLAWDATGVNLYVDGFSKFSAAGGATVASHASTGFALGMPNDTIGDLVTDGSAWQGNYTDARIYARKLGDGDAARLWEPSSRWELYRPVGRPAFFLPTTTAGGIQVKSGTFQCPGASGSQAVTGVGFTPTALMLWSAGDFSDGAWRGSQEPSFGVASGTGAQFVSAGGHVSGGASCRRTDTKLGISIQGDQTVKALGTLASLDADGFTITWSGVVDGGRYFHYLALGGVTAKAVAWDAVTTTGNQSVTGVGFTPDLVIHSNGYITAGYGTTTDWYLALGAMDSGNHQWAAAAVDTSGGRNRLQRTDSCLALTTGTGTSTGRATFVSMDADGFTVNWATAPSLATRTHSLCLRGLRARCGSFNKSTAAATASQGVTGVGFTPVGLWLASWMSTASTSILTTGAMLSNGFAHTTGGGHGVASGNTTVNAFDRSTKAVGVANSSTQALDAEADVSSQDADGFTLSWTTNNAVATEVLYLALGQPAGSRRRRVLLCAGGG